MYLTYAEYVSYGGNAITSAAEFAKYEIIAAGAVDWHTMNRLHKIIFAELPAQTVTSIKNCMFLLVDLYKTQDIINSTTGDSSLVVNAGIHEMSNDGVSIKYNTQTADVAYANVQAKITTTLKQTLSGIVDKNNRVLTYRGVYPGE